MSSVSCKLANSAKIQTPLSREHSYPASICQGWHAIIGIMVNLTSKMKQHLPAELIAFLHTAREEAEAQGERLYLVGGAVRDLLLERPNLDFDLVVEGDAPRLAHRLAKTRGERVTIHRQFGTAKFRRGNLTIDLVTARSETYAKPGALPTVQPGTIWDDLLRRDFTINAMAIDLSPANFGQLLDPHGVTKNSLPT